MSRESEVASRKRKAAPASSTSPPVKKPKKITGPPPRSQPFIRRHELSKNPPMSMYWGAADQYHLKPLFESNGDVFKKLPKLAKKHPYFPDLITDRLHADRQKPVDGFDTTKKHFDAAHAKVERAVEITEEQATRMAHVGRMPVEEAQACHKWVGQVGTMTDIGYHGRMKNYDAFQDALKKVSDLAKKAEKTVEEVKEHAKKWTMEFIAQRKAWDEEEVEYEDAEEEVFEDEGESFADKMEEMRARVMIDRGFSCRCCQLSNGVFFPSSFQRPRFISGSFVQSQVVNHPHTTAMSLLIIHMSLVIACRVALLKVLVLRPHVLPNLPARGTLQLYLPHI